ncbi:hypothetical protein C8R47DRAFT_1219246 [Mycena vitilis]|nr:hypothetical protein C8R47DRAFT_1219246 [Mycena vitilis]
MVAQSVYKPLASLLIFSILDIRPLSLLLSLEALGPPALCMGICDHSACLIALAVGPASHAVVLNIFFLSLADPSAFPGRLGTLFARRLLDINHHQRRSTSVDQESGFESRLICFNPLQSGERDWAIVDLGLENPAYLDSTPIFVAKCLTRVDLPRSGALQARRLFNTLSIRLSFVQSTSFGVQHKPQGLVDSVKILSVHSPLDLVGFEGRDTRAPWLQAVAIVDQSLIHKPTLNDLPWLFNAEIIVKLDQRAVDSCYIWVQDTIVGAYRGVEFGSGTPRLQPKPKGLKHSHRNIDLCRIGIGVRVVGVSQTRRTWLRNIDIVIISPVPDYGLFRVHKVRTVIRSY